MSVIIPDSVARLFNRVFSGCTNLVSIVIPSLNVFSGNSFEACGCPLGLFAPQTTLCNCTVGSCAPTAAPSLSPTKIPTVSPSAVPTPLPTVPPSAAPTATPTTNPTLSPTTTPPSVSLVTPAPLPVITTVTEDTGEKSSSATLVIVIAALVGFICVGTILVVWFVVIPRRKELATKKVTEYLQTAHVEVEYDEIEDLATNGGIDRLAETDDPRTPSVAVPATHLDNDMYVGLEQDRSVTGGSVVGVNNAAANTLDGYLYAAETPT